MPLISALGRLGQADLCEFETSLVYKASSRIARTITQRIPAWRRGVKERLFKQSNT